MSNFNGLIGELSRPEDLDRWRFFSATTIDTPTGSPAKVTVDLGEGHTTRLRFPQGTAPGPGTTVWVAQEGSEARFIAFVLA